jgi:general secretion pathway protein D
MSSDQIKKYQFTKQRKPKMGLLIATFMIQLNGCQSVEPLEVDSRVENRLKNPKKALQIDEKIDNINAREEKIKQLLEQAEIAWMQVDFEKLTDIYTELQAYDPGNIRASDGFLRLEFAKKHQQLYVEAQALLGNDEANNKIAMQKLHAILLENPHHLKALSLYDQLAQSQEKNTREKLIKKLDFNKNVTMEFRDVPIKKIFEGLSKTTNINFILDKDIPENQKATIFVSEMAFEDAFDLLLQTNTLAKKVLSENTVIIYKNDQIRQRIYEELIVRSYVLDYADGKKISAILRSMLGINRIEVDERLNTLIIKETPEVLAIAEKIIRAQDFPDAEVMLEVQILEIRRSYLENLGVTTPGGVTIPVPTNGLTIKDLSVSTDDLLVNGVPSLLFNSTNGNVNLLANPRIRVKNKENAKIHIGEKVPIFTSNVASTGVASQTVQYIDAGIKLEVEPTISTMGDVTIKLNLNVGAIGDRVTATAGDNQSVAFRVGTRFTSTTLRLHDGETQILAGLIDDQDRKNVSGIPGLANLPIIGRLFSNQTDDKVKTEIVLSITPYVVRERKMQTADQAETWVGSEGQTGIRSSTPRFIKGQSPFIIPKPPSSQQTAPPDEVPKNINIQLPKNFSLGNGLSDVEDVEIK